MKASLFFTQFKNQLILESKKTNSYKISESQLIILKGKYYKDFIKYWTAGSKPPKFNPISMGEFKKRLENQEFF